MSERLSDGTTRVCDGKCYNATGPDCECVCGALNHGVGLRQAKLNVQMLEELKAEAEEYARLVHSNVYHMSKYNEDDGEDR
jgi:hypothetical protein